ncbi:MAG: 2,3-bisphosphoglycerate-independent phosphoglycerate mutase [Candidatus Pacebacteria bacterium]|nr:2,3-bisphosphoglycerate-independent phosphoglycerate mutase [Candidatus Paceibacterota bacterium]
MKNKILLVICDGLGFTEKKEYNAIASASTPSLDGFRASYPFALLEASGEAIGLPEGQMGTSEANHLVMGSGRIIYHNLVKINKAVDNKELEKNPAIVEAFEHAKKHNSSLHIKGIISDGGVHGHSRHLKGLVEAARVHGVKKVFLHLFTDGRDVAPKSAADYIKDLEGFLKRCGLGKIASVGGRYWGMDRDNNYDRVEKHFLAITKGLGPKFKTALEVIEHNYDLGKTDEFIEPSLIETEEESGGIISVNDAVIFANFRADRAKQLTKRVLDERINNLKFVAMTKYDDNLDVKVAFPPEEIKNTLSEVISANGLSQMKVTETEKFAHLTFFFNAQRYDPEKNEDRIMINTNKDVETHDQKPEMKADDIAQAVVSAVKENKYGFIAVNLTNCDMVGHTGNFPAIVKAVEAVDSALGKIYSAAKEYGYDMIVTADHGNAEETFGNGQPLTSHTVNPVPFYLLSDKYKNLKRIKGNLADIAPTVLTMLHLRIPKEMTGKPLV